MEAPDLGTPFHLANFHKRTGMFKFVTAFQMINGIPLLKVTAVRNKVYAS